ncbi:MAG: hypothetical protein WBP85_09595, partial [Terracidiphilus sp.]
PYVASVAPKASQNPNRYAIATALQRGAIQRMERKKRNQGRSTVRKGGPKNQRDKKPGLMSDPQFGKAFTQFWHWLKQTFSNDRTSFPDYQAEFRDQTREEITGVAREDIDGWDTKTIWELFVEYQEKHGLKLQDVKVKPQERNYDLPPSGSDDEDGPDGIFA